jgi:acyl carrier protein
MNAMDTCDSLHRLAADLLKIPIESVQRAKSLREAGIDSLATLDLIFAIEARFAISIGVEDVSDVRSVRDLAVIVDRLVTRKAHCHVEE